MIRFIGWLCRVMVWLIVWPLGLVLSLVHGANKRNKRLVKAVKEGS